MGLIPLWHSATHPGSNPLFDCNNPVPLPLRLSCQSHNVPKVHPLSQIVSPNSFIWHHPCCTMTNRTRYRHVDHLNPCLYKQTCYISMITKKANNLYWIWARCMFQRMFYSIVGPCASTVGRLLLGVRVKSCCRKDSHVSITTLLLEFSINHANTI